MAHARWWSCRSCGRCRAGEGRGGSPETQGHPWRPMETQLAVTRTIPGLEQWLVVLSRWFSSKYIGLLSNIKTIFVWHAWDTLCIFSCAHSPLQALLSNDDNGERVGTCDNMRQPSFTYSYTPSSTAVPPRSTKYHRVRLRCSRLAKHLHQSLARCCGCNWHTRISAEFWHGRGF
jgi:hypothetical protein